MNTETTRFISQPPLRRVQPQTLIRPHTTLPQKKFTPASRRARLQSWQQRMKLLFARQSY